MAAKHRGVLCAKHDCVLKVSCSEHIAAVENSSVMLDPAFILKLYPSNTQN